uniref:Reverse transcriptase domain-containing protein n=1 Tax=Nothobranchius furzeri TaxID=105023 RepID=A0A8C6KGR8_NOTFU
MQIVNRHVPLKKCRIKGRENPWFSPELANMIHERNRAWDKARTTELTTDWSVFRQLRNKCTSLIKKAKSEYFLSVTTENLKDPQRFWKVIMSFAVEKISQALPTFVLRDSVPVYNRLEILNCFNEHFLSVGSLFNFVGTPLIKYGIIPPDFSGAPFNFKPFTVHEVHKALKSIDHRKPPGPDFMEPYFLKMAEDYVAEPLSILFNLSINSKEIPSQWKSAYVLPLLKGGDPAVLTNYRPISNLSVLSKIMESLVSVQLKEFLSINDILSKCQSGFRKGYSTTTAVMKVVNDIIVVLDRKQFCASLFIDLSKAFDTVDHAILINRLISLGLSEHSVAWFSNYLTNRTQCVKCEDLCSDFGAVQRGVPQGSVLGPLLFILYINDLGQNIKDANIHFYADDTIIYCFGTSLSQVVESLQKAFDLVQHSLHQLKLTLNAEKTKLTFFTNRQIPNIVPKLITLEGKVIEMVHEYKYLGVWIDNSLTFKSHIDKLVKKLKLKLGLYFRNKLCFSFYGKKQLVTTTFLSVLDFGDLIYMNASLTVLQKLDSVYHASLRFITNCRAITHHCELYSRVKWPSLAIRRQNHWYVFI